MRSRSAAAAGWSPSMTREEFAIPKSRRFALVGARILASCLPKAVADADSNGFIVADILVDDGRIAEIAAAGAYAHGESPRLLLSGRIVLPLFVDAHTHLDKGHIWRRTPNPTGEFATALKAVIEDRTARWSAADVDARMEFALRCAYAHGTSAIRTHIDSVGAQTRISWPVFAAARERWRGRIELQGTPLFGIDFA